MTAGRFYFAEPNTPHLGARHNLGSRNWHDSNWEIEQALGEDLETVQPWDNGSVPVVLPTNQIVGRVPCLTDGEDISHALEPGTLVDGFPRRCFMPLIPTDQQWQEMSSFNEPALQLFYARILDWQYADESTRIEQAFRSMLGPDVQIRFHPQQGLMPSVVTVISPTYSIAIIDGTRDFPQLSTQAFQAIEGPQDFGAFSTLPLWYDASNHANDFLTADGANPTAPIMIVGHSYGAATAEILAARYRNWNPNRDVRWLTFGSPKIGDQRLVDLVRQSPGMAMSNSNDLVTITPPNRLEILPVAAILGRPDLLVYATWQRPPNQVRQDPNGSLHPNQLLPWDTAALSATVQGILNGQGWNPFLGHSIPYYIERIQLRAPAAQWPVTPATYQLLLSAGDIRLNASGPTIVGGRGTFNPATGVCGFVLGGTGGTGTYPPSLPAGVRLGGTGGTGYPVLPVGGVRLGGACGTGVIVIGTGGVLLGGTGGDGSAPAGDGGIEMGGDGGDGSAPAGDGGAMFGGTG